MLFENGLNFAPDEIVVIQRATITNRTNVHAMIQDGILAPVELFARAV
jgi:hypothetical protein